MIGDCPYDASLWFLPASLWTPSSVVRRLKAVCASLSRATALLRAYDISAYTPPEELVENVLALINDARVAWPTQAVVEGARSEKAGVWRYAFDQEGPARGIPHHATDLIYLFDNIPVPMPTSQPFETGSFDENDEWTMPVVDDYSYERVRDVIQERWIAFAHGEAPWNENKVFVFGPEGEVGERSSCIFEGRRRTQIWKEALEPLGMQLVQKIGTELSNGPPSNAS
jgi:carboxylesterase type B